MRQLAAFLCVTFILLAGCDSGNEPLGITGDWEGELTNEASVYPVTVTFRDTGARVTGTGTVSLTDGPFPFSVTGGTFVNGVAQLDLLFSVVPPNGQISASLTQTDPGVLEGTFQGVGEANGALRIELVDR